MAGLRLAQDNANMVLTYCPRRFFPPFCTSGRVQGYGASSLWKQRACRWFLSWPRQLPKELWLAFTYNAGTWYGNIQYRVYFLWWLFLNLVSVGWVPYMFYVWLKHESWILVVILKAMLTMTGISVAFIRIIFFPKRLRRGLHPITPFCSPILGLANSILRFFGFLQCIYWFIPFVRVGKLQVLGEQDHDEEEGNESSGSETGLQEGPRGTQTDGENFRPVPGEDALPGVESSDVSSTEEPTESEAAWSTSDMTVVFGQRTTTIGSETVNVVPQQIGVAAASTEMALDAYPMVSRGRDAPEGNDSW